MKLQASAQACCLDTLAALASLALCLLFRLLWLLLQFLLLSSCSSSACSSSAARSKRASRSMLVQVSKTHAPVYIKPLFLKIKVPQSGAPFGPISGSHLEQFRSHFGSYFEPKWSQIEPQMSTSSFEIDRFSWGSFRIHFGFIVGANLTPNHSKLSP